MEIYLDNAATTRAYESVCQIMVKTMRQDYGNPSALHMKGVEAEHYVKNARQYIARTLKIGEKELIFTSGGTESNIWPLSRRYGQLPGRKASYHHRNRTCLSLQSHDVSGKPGLRGDLSSSGFHRDSPP